MLCAWCEGSHCTVHMMQRFPLALCCGHCVVLQLCCMCGVNVPLCCVHGVKVPISIVLCAWCEGSHWHCAVCMVMVVWMLPLYCACGMKVPTVLCVV